MYKLAAIRESVSALPINYTRLINNLKKHGSLEGEEKIACEKAIVEDFEKEAIAWKPMWEGIKAFGRGFKPLWTGAKQVPGALRGAYQAGGPGALSGMRNAVGQVGRQVGSGLKSWAGANPWQATTLGGASILGGYGMGKMSSEKTAVDWGGVAKTIGLGAIGSTIPIGIAAALGYAQLKKEIKNNDMATQKKLQGMQDELSSVGAAADLYGLNQLFGQGGQDTQSGQVDPYTMGQGGQVDPYAMSQDYQSYSPQDFGYKFSSLNDSTFYDKLEKVASARCTRIVLRKQVSNPSLSKEARDIASDLVATNDSNLVEGLKDLLINKD
jgi:hypothetical protein